MVRFLGSSSSPFDKLLDELTELLHLDCPITIIPIRIALQSDQ